MISRMLSTAIACLFAGMALAGCAANNNGGSGGGTPQAAASVTPSAPEVGETVQFSAANTAASDTVTWNFGDGQTGTGASATHAYQTPGQYIVHLNVTNEGGRTATNDAALTYLTVSPPALDIGNITTATLPVATAASSTQVIAVGGSVSFDATGSGAWAENPDFDPTDPIQTASHNPPFAVDPSNVTFAWDFGDGQTGTGDKVNHTFATGGIYPVKLTVTEGTKSASYIVTIRVLPEVSSSTTVRNPNVITDVTIGEPESLDPAYDYESAGGHVIQQVYETLYAYDRDSAERLQPALAVSMPTYSDDRTTLTIKLRENVKFHNGATMTAEDVKFSWDRAVMMNDPDSPAWILNVIKGAEAYHGTEGTAEDRAAYLAAGGVTVKDPLTLEVKLDYPDPGFLYKISYSVAAVVSKEGVCANDEPDFVDCLPPPGETRHPWMDTHEVGTGPYVLEAWIPGQQIILKRFDQYWGEKPAIEKIIRQKVGDINTRLLMLFSGQADSIYVPVDHDKDVMGKEGVDVVENPSWIVSFIGFNQKFCGGPEASTFQSCMDANSADAPKGADGTPDPLFFSDINMRKAWTYAFDYDTYYNNILNKHGRMLNGPLPQGIFGFDESIPQPKRDLEQAKQFFQQTKHKDGFSITIFYNSDNTVREKTANLLAQNLRELGSNVNVDVRGLDWSTAFLPKQRALALPVFYLGWAPDYAYPDNYVVTFAHSENGVYAGRVGYENPTLNAQLDALVRETDEAKLEQGWSDAVKALNNDFVFLWLAQASNFHVHRDWVQGYYYNPMNSGEPNIGDYTTIKKG